MNQLSIGWMLQLLANAHKVNWHLDNATHLTRFCTDTRTLKPGDVFIALSGPNFDGNQFVKTAFEKGALCAIVNREMPCDLPQLVVNDPLKVYGLLAADNKRRSHCSTIAITGSAGKTSVKEMCAAILQQLGKTLATQGNFNNEIGVPHTLMQLNSTYDYAVIELGANHAGEIAYTVGLTQPDVAILNNVSAAHIEGFGSLEGIATAKGEIFSGLTEQGIAVINAESEFKPQWLSFLTEHFDKPEQQIIEFTSNDKSATHYPTIYAKDIQTTSDGCAEFTMVFNDQQHLIRLPIPGMHNINNALAAAAACIKLGASLEHVAKGLLVMKQTTGRVNLLKLKQNLLVIDDSYNANVGSVKAAIDLLSSYDGLTALVLGDMAEMGDFGLQYHLEVGKYAHEKEISNIFSFGDLSEYASKAFGDNAKHFDQRTPLHSAIATWINSTTEPKVILIKGSRSAQMEQTVEYLKTNNNNNNDIGAPC